MLHIILMIARAYAGALDIALGGHYRTTTAGRHFTEERR